MCGHPFNLYQLHSVISCCFSSSLQFFPQPKLRRPKHIFEILHEPTNTINELLWQKATVKTFSFFIKSRKEDSRKQKSFLRETRNKYKNIREDRKQKIGRRRRMKSERHSATSILQRRFSLDKITNLSLISLVILTRFFLSRLHFKQRDLSFCQTFD